LNTAVTTIGHPSPDATVLTVSPDECIVWADNQRKAEGLNETSCGDLIESFTSQGVQHVPAIARMLPKPKGKVKYEIIAGRRRHWSARYVRDNGCPDFQFKILIETLTDKEAFKVACVENLERQDISAYERGLDYTRAVELYYGGVQAEMAKDLGKPNSWVSEHIAIAALPIQIPNAFANWSDLKQSHLRKLKALLSPKNKRAMNAVLKKATELHLVHLKRAHNGRKPFSGARVMRILTQAGKLARVKSRQLATYGPTDAPHMQVKSSNKASFQLTVSKESGASVEDLLKCFRECLGDQLGAAGKGKKKGKAKSTAKNSGSRILA